MLITLRGEVDPKLWYQFGLAIGIQEDILEKFIGYPEVECMIELADYWLRNHPTKPTWSDIRDAMRSIKPANDLTTYDFPGKLRKHAILSLGINPILGSLMEECSYDLLNYSSDIPKSSRPRLQKAAPPSPKNKQVYSITPPRPSKP